MSARAARHRELALLYIDAARFAENAFLARSRDPQLEGKSLPEIARAYFDLADGCTMSAKKDQRYRHASIEYLTDRLYAKGIPHVRPAGGHAVDLDANRFLDHLDVSELPGQALAIALYLHGGVRSCEIGSVMFGQFEGTVLRKPAEHDLVRLAFPRRVYTQSHVDYLAEVVEELYDARASVPGVHISSCPEHLRHFSARFELVPSASP
jgi:tryptophanase